MKLEQSFEVDAPLERVWQTLIDVEHVAPCLPGAAVTGRNDDGSYNGTFTVKIGPTTASYSGKLEMESIDEASHTATMQAQGTDKRGQGGAKATIYSRLAPADGRGTRVEVVTDYHITGRLARFGRGGMIEDISERLLREFAKRLQSSLVSQQDTIVSEPAVPEAAVAPEASGGARGRPWRPRRPPRSRPGRARGPGWDRSASPRSRPRDEDGVRAGADRERAARGARVAATTPRDDHATPPVGRAVQPVATPEPTAPASGPLGPSRPSPRLRRRAGRRAGGRRAAGATATAQPRSATGGDPAAGTLDGRRASAAPASARAERADAGPVAGRRRGVGPDQAQSGASRRRGRRGRRAAAGAPPASAPLIAGTATCITCHSSARAARRGVLRMPHAANPSRRPARRAEWRVMQRPATD